MSILSRQFSGNFRLPLFGFALWGLNSYAVQEAKPRYRVAALQRMRTVSGFCLQRIFAKWVIIYSSGGYFWGRNASFAYWFLKVVLFLYTHFECIFYNKISTSPSLTLDT